MGLLDAIFGGDTEWYIKKANKLASQSNPGEALALLKKAEKKAKSGSDTEKIDQARKEIEHTAYLMAVEQAKSYMRGHMHQNAQNAIDRAVRFAHTEEERESVRAIIDSDLYHDDGESAAEVDEVAKVEGEEKVSGMEFLDKWQLYVSRLTFGRAQHFDELGVDFKKAWVALQEGQFDEAIRGLEEAHKKFGDDADVLVELARAYQGKGEFDKALPFAAKASEKSPTDIDTLLLHTQILWSLKKLDEAEGVLQKAYDLEPDNNNVLAMVAQQGLLTKEYESAIAAVEQLIENAPKDISVRRLAARIYLESGDEEKALESYETVNRIFWQVDPRTKKITFDQNSAVAAASLYFKRGENLDRAVELLDAVRAETKDEAHVAICMQLAEVYDKMGKKAKREEVYTEALRFLDELYDGSKGDKRANLAFQYADICNKCGQKEKGAAKLEEGLKFLDDLYEKAEGDRRVNLAMQYAEICDKCGERDRGIPKMNEARNIVAVEANKGNPLAQLALDLIEKRINGEELPSPEEYAKKQQEILEDLMKRRISDLASKSQASEADEDAEESASAPVQTVQVANPSVVDNDAANALLRSFASMAPVHKPEPEPSSDDASSESSDSAASSDDSKEDNA